MLPKHITRHHFKRLSPEIKQYEPVSIEEWAKNFHDACEIISRGWKVRE
ncbi:MAG: hypothetical protein PHG06_00095 [Parabacteroides sp.]|nr:hypothetical protein [Parabacteroides sp.]